jgi:hypothetical protein
MRLNYTVLVAETCAASVWRNNCIAVVSRWQGKPRAGHVFRTTQGECRPAAAADRACFTGVLIIITTNVHQVPINIRLGLHQEQVHCVHRCFYGVALRQLL